MIKKRFIALTLVIVILAAIQLPVLATDNILDKADAQLSGFVEIVSNYTSDDEQEQPEEIAEDEENIEEYPEEGVEDVTEEIPEEESEETTDEVSDEEPESEEEPTDETEESSEEDTEESEEESLEEEEAAEEKEDEAESKTAKVEIGDFDWERINSRNIESTFGDIFVTESLASTDYGQHCEKMYSYPDGSFFASRRLYIDGVLSTDFELFSMEVECEALTMRYYNTVSQKWVEREMLSDSRMSYGMYFLTFDDGSEMIISLPQAYVEKSNNAIQAQEGQTGDLCMEPTETGWRISIMAPYVYSESFVDYFVLYSNDDIINWNKAQTKTQWAGCQFGGDNRWCYNGYYYTSPSNYIPSGTNYYHRLPAAYIACKFVPMGLESNAAKYMCIAMLDVMRDLQNERGYFPTLSGSQWLLSDYNIGPGFYDTRFNTDLVRAFLQAYSNYGIEEFWTVVENYMDYYIPFVLRNHDSVTLNDGWPGWLVYDYIGQYGGKKTHTSLNHQVAQIILMEEIYLVTGNTLVRFLEEMMYRGIQGTEKMWYMSNNNLEYAYFNGKAAEGMQDYPYLTYNDLYELADMYSERLGYVPSTIRNLMNSKKKWMDANGVTGYKGSYVEAPETEYTGSVVLTEGHSVVLSEE